MKIKFVAKVLSFLLLCAMLVSLVACKSNDSTEESGILSETSTESSEEQKSAQEWIATLDDTEEYNNRTFVIATTNPDLFSGEGDSLIDKAVIKRNRLVEAKYSVNIQVKLVEDAEALAQGLKNAEKSGVPYADLVCTNADVLATLVSSGYLKNLYSIPHLNLEAGYVGSKLVEAQTINNSLYMLSSGMTMNTSDLWAVYYDKQLVAEAGFDPVQMVEDGTWTWDAMLQIIKTVCADTLKKESPDVSRDTFGIASYYSYSDLTDAVWASGGNRFFGDSYNKEPVVSVDDSTVTTVSATVSKLENNGVLFKNTGAKALEAFTEGRAAFFVYKMDMVYKLDKATREWGLLPLPKMTKEQENYCSFLDGSAYAIAVPSSIEDSDFAGAMLNCLFAASADEIDEALQSAFINYYFWNNDSTKMLALIRKTAFYDPAYFYNEVSEVADVSTKALNTAVNESTDFSDELSTKEKSAFEQFSKSFFK